MHDRLLYASPLLSIHDVCCRPESPDCGAEEHVTEPKLVFPRSGVFVKHLHRERIIADPNHILFFNGGRPYRVSHPVPGGDDCTSYGFEPGLLHEMTAASPLGATGEPDAPFPISHALSAPRLALLQHALRRRLIGKQMSALEIEETALALLHAALGGSKPPVRAASAGRAATARLRARWIEAAKVLLAGRPDANLGLSELAREVHCSPFHLARLFREAVGLPIHQYQLRVRLALALERLADGDGNLLTLALDLGFANHSHFTATFKRSFGFSPSALRRSATGEGLAQMRKNLTV